MKKLKFIFLALLTCSQIAVAQSNDVSLEVADSLFNARRYTQSLSMYESLYLEQSVASPAMLLKMAYSEEALGNISQALVYLHDYHRFTEDEDVLDKMNELAAVNGLEGYELSEYEKLKKTLHEYQYWIFLALVLFSVIILFMMLRKLKKHEQRSPSLAISLVLVLAIGVYVLNFTESRNKGIIQNDNAYIMSGPSAAAELIEVVNQGHKIEILGKNDIWVEVIWRGQKAYIRESNIQRLL